MVERATETERLKREIASVRASVASDSDLTGASAVINAVRATLKCVASTGSRVMITGPAGVGQEIAARLLYGWSPQIGRAHVCTTVTNPLLVCRLLLAKTTSIYHSATRLLSILLNITNYYTHT